MSIYPDWDCPTGSTRLEAISGQLDYRCRNKTLRFWNRLFGVGKYSGVPYSQRWAGSVEDSVGDPGHSGRRCRPAAGTRAPPSRNPNASNNSTGNTSPTTKRSAAAISLARLCLEPGPPSAPTPTGCPPPGPPTRVDRRSPFL